MTAAAVLSLTSCYDLGDMSHNPFAIETNTSQQDTTKIEDNTKYADINIDFKVSKEDSAELKTVLADAPATSFTKATTTTTR